MIRPTRTLAVLAALVVLSGRAHRAGRAAGAPHPHHQLLREPLRPVRRVRLGPAQRDRPPVAGARRVPETPLELARFEDVGGEGPFARYVGTLVTGRQPDLVITIGGPAAHFAASHREELSAAVPLLITGLDARHRPELAEQPNQVIVDFNLHPAAVVGDILRLLPDTTTLAIVLGNSPLEKFWHAQLEQELRPLAGRLQLAWLDTLSLEQMRQRVSTLPAHSAILFGVLFVDSAGIPQEEDQGLMSLSAVARSPMFGGFESQLGHGVVGGPLLSIAAAGRRSAAVALRILGGESVERLAVPPAQAERSIYDWRELHRWNIPERRLPPGSDVRFHPPSLWEAYRRPLVAGLLLVGLEALLIGSAARPARAPPSRRGTGPGAQPPPPDRAGRRAQGPRARAPRRLQPAAGAALDRRGAARRRSRDPARRRRVTRRCARSSRGFPRTSTRSRTSSIPRRSTTWA